MPNQLIDEDLQSAAFNHSAIPPDFKNAYFSQSFKSPWYFHDTLAIILSSPVNLKETVYNSNFHEANKKSY
jgi:hypothetical protein